MGRGLEKKGNMVRDLEWRNRGYRGGGVNVEQKEDGPGHGSGDQAQDGFAHLDTKTWRGERGGGVEARRVGERPEAILSSIVCLSQ